MIQSMDRLLVERQALDQGMSACLILSVAGHLFLISTGIIIPRLLPKPSPLRIQEGFIVTLPRGGGGVRDAAPAAGDDSASPPAPVAPKVEAPPKVLKPPQEQIRRGLPDPDARQSRRAQPTPAARYGGASGGTGTSAGPYGLEFLPPGPGVPGGTDLLGDFYLAGVQRKIWMIWVQQLRAQARNAVIVSFTILTDGTVSDIRVVQSSGVTLVDMAAQRAIASASPFSPLPERYGTNRFTIQAIFRPST